jgi:hypothetical protein
MMPKAKKPLPVELIKEYLALEEGGILVWKKSPHPKIPVGTKAGRQPKGHHLQVTLQRAAYGYHRIVYYLAYGVDSVGYEIDHINRDPLDNRPENLRLATEIENKWNKGCSSRSQSGYRGIRKRFWGKSYSWEVRFRGKYVGTYKTLEEAIAAWESVAKPFAGEFFCPAGIS